MLFILDSCVDFFLINWFITECMQFQKTMKNDHNKLSWDDDNLFCLPNSPETKYVQLTTNRWLIDYWIVDESSKTKTYFSLD